MTYFDIDEYRTVADKQKTDGRDSDTYIGLAEQWARNKINTVTGRDFDLYPSAMYLADTDGDTLLIPEFVSISTLSDNATGERVAYVGEGLKLGWPIERLTLTGAAIPKTVKITGVRGWPSVPVAIKLLAIELAAMWRLDGPRAWRQGGISEGPTENVAKDAASLIQETIYDYCRQDGIYVARLRQVS